MTKDEWCRNRILWKASQHKLFERKAYQLSDLTKEQFIAINKNLPNDIIPVIVFFESESRWTVLGTRVIASYFDERLSTVNLDDIKKKVTLYTPKNCSGQDAKFISEYIILENVNQIIWAPAGAELFALMGILLIFPLSNNLSLSESKN